MMNNNKILTVSYGTFSCTLEGFEDSFDTMKAIAEYFRDLASDDRYFGAEPPQPDAEMLARIAEREVARRVEAREHEGHFMLKAHDEAPAASAAPTAASLAPTLPAENIEEPQEAPAEPVQQYVAEPAPEATQEVAAPEHTEEVAEETAAEEATQDAPDASDVTLETADAETESFDAADVAEAEEIAGDTEEAIADPASEVEFDSQSIEETVELAEVEDTAEVEEAAEVEDIAAAFVEETPAVEDATQIDDAEDTDTSAAAFFADSTFVDATDPETEEEISAEVFTDFTSQEDEADPADDTLIAEDVEAPVAESATESFAAKLERIRAVVSQREDTAIDVDYEEEEVAAEPASSFDPLPSSFAAFNQADESEEADEAEDALAAAAEDISEALEQDSETYAEGEASEVEADDLDSILGRIEANSDQEDADEDFDLVSETEEESEPAENLFGHDDAADEPEELDAAEMHGRVLKVNRAEFEAALETGELEEYEEIYEDDSLTDAPALDADEEAQLQNDLAELEEDIADASDVAASARESLPELGEDASEDVSRLMAEADEQMNEPEARTRRSAFAHLRAAVAARFADRSMDDGQKKVEEEAQAYRSDLAEVVKPRRPMSESTSRTQRPTEATAPLKLVAEQRIDTGEDDRGPIAPRRVAASTEEDIDLAEDSGFAAYAQERGATSLTELLEAAAAYLAYVEGHDQFSRPQLMKRVRQADCGDFSREDGLRSFGQLLRNGKIEKIKGGRFAASERIGYKPDHRAAG